MAARLADDFGAAGAMGVGQNAQKVSHGTAGHKEGVLLAHDPGGHLLQADEGGILAVDVVAHLLRWPSPGASRRWEG